MPQSLHVSPSGDDTNDGSLAAPFQTINRARECVRQHPDFRRKPLMVYVRGGTTYLDDTLVFTSKDSGTAEAPVTYAAYADETVVISGGMTLDLEWTPYRDGIMQASTPVGLTIDELFVNGQRQHMARYPTFDPDTMPYNGFAADAFSPERAARWQDPAGGYIHAMHAHNWGGYHYRITGKDADHTVSYEGGWQNNRQMGMHDEFRFVENIFEELDAPGEWYHDDKSNTLYFYPTEGLDIESATIEVTRLMHLIELQGTKDEPVQHLHFRGFTFRHAARTFMETREQLLRSDWAICRGGAVLISGAEDCSITDCEFDQVGGNAIFVDTYNRRIAVRGCHIHGAGASAVCFVGNPEAVRDSLFEYSERQAYDDIDLTPGPKTDDYPADCEVEDCLIHSIGIVEKQATGVQISMSSGITVRHCSIYDVGRAGININEGTFGGHLIEFCDVFDTVRETGDHGSFNSWGRDRFWQLEGAPPEKLGELALLDAKKTIIRNSRWRCDRGWDIDLDDGSTNYEIYNNLMLRGGLKLREGFCRHAYNNIGVNCSIHAHVWYPESLDKLHNNLWLGRFPKPILMPGCAWGEGSDYNLFLCEEERKKATVNGWDAHSVVGDPCFVDAAAGDFRVRPESPALKLGFKNFPMDRFGVQSPDLKAIARTPGIPEFTPVVESNNEADQSIVWKGVTLKALVGEEFSAFGVNKEDGGLAVLKIAKELPLQIGDLIQSVNDTSTPDIAAFKKVVSQIDGSAVTFGIVRDQQASRIQFSE